MPSKYLDLPVASLGNAATVTLKRASLVKPQRTKNDRSRVSSWDRSPSANAHTAGDTPKEICQREFSILGCKEGRRQGNERIQCCRGNRYLDMNAKAKCSTCANAQFPSSTKNGTAWTGGIASSSEPDLPGLPENPAPVPSNCSSPATWPLCRP